MLPRTLRRVPFAVERTVFQETFVPRTLCRRYASTNRNFNDEGSRNNHARRGRGRVIAAASGATGLLILLGISGIPANSNLAASPVPLASQGVGFAGTGMTADSQPQEPLTSLVRRYIVYTMCSIPGLVEVSPTILDVVSKIPVVRSITEAIVRVTFFDQFVGGDTVHDMLPVLHSLRATNKGAICNYSVEENPNAITNAADSAPHKRVVEEMIHAIDVVGDFEDSVTSRYVPGQSNGAGRRTWVALKLTALLPSTKPLHHLSAYLLATRPALPTPIPYPGCAHGSDLDVLYTGSKPVSGPLTDQDLIQLRDLHSDLRRICQKAEERGVRLVIDAEYSWYQPAMDAFQLALMREFNRCQESKGQRAQPLVYGTYQAYLRRTPAQLAHDLADAQKYHYALGVKLVRGAYHHYEIEAHQNRGNSTPSVSLSLSNESEPPVWMTKQETDKCFDTCVRVLIERVRDDVQSQDRTGTPRIGILFGTHNWTSSKLVLSELVRWGLAGVSTTSTSRHGSGSGLIETPTNEQDEQILSIPGTVADRVCMGHLYGMNDMLSDYIVKRTSGSSDGVPMVVKYIPYGALSEVMPYLSRRAIENQSVLGNDNASEERRRAGREIWRRVFG